MSKHILTTLVYYDVLDYPMTGFEVWKYLTTVNSEQGTMNNASNYSLADIIKELESDKLKKIAEEYRGFYFLRGRKNLVEQRIRRNKISQRKHKALNKAARILRAVPFVRMIAVTGRLAMNNADEKSDLDLLVVIKGGKIFTGRLLVTLAAHLLGKRRYKEKIADRICLNYFITENSLEIGIKDMFSSSEYCFALPLFGLEAFRKFREKNRWISEYKFNYERFGSGSLKTVKDSFFSKAARNFGEKILGADFIEKTLKSWQMKRINRNPKTSQPGSMVSANDRELVFLPNPQGPKVYDRFREKLSLLKLS